MKAVFIDNNPINVIMIEEMLNGICEITGAGNAEKGFQIIHEMMPDVIFLDINLPGMNGFQILDQLRLQSHFEQIPVIALTSHSIYDEEVSSMADRFDAYVLKPFRRSELVNIVSDYIH